MRLIAVPLDAFVGKFVGLVVGVTIELFQYLDSSIAKINDFRS